MNEIQQISDTWNLLCPKCPYNKSILVWLFRLVIIVFGTVGLMFFNEWVSVIYLTYSVFFNFYVMPIKHCQYCYYSVKEHSVENKEKNRPKKLLPIEKWKECYLEKHVVCGKKWGFSFFILWLVPIVLIVISLFTNYSIVALASLIGFIVFLAIMLIYVRLLICPKCAFMKECHEAF